jgi:transaldolase
MIFALSARSGPRPRKPLLFVGRLDDVPTNGLQLIGEIIQIYDNHGFATEVLWRRCGIRCTCTRPR